MTGLYLWAPDTNTLQREVSIGTYTGAVLAVLDREEDVDVVASLLLDDEQRQYTLQMQEGARFLLVDGRHAGPPYLQR